MTKVHLLIQIYSNLVQNVFEAGKRRLTKRVTKKRENISIELLAKIKML